MCNNQNSAKKEEFKFNGIYKLKEGGLEYFHYNDSSQVYHIDPVPVIKVKDFVKVKKQKNEYNMIELYIRIDDKYVEKFADITTENIGKPLIFILNDKLVAAPIVQTEISGGVVVLTGIDENLIDEIIKTQKQLK